MSDDLGRAPTRRSLREQRRAGETADRARDRDRSVGEQPATDADSSSSGDTNQLERVAKANRSRRAADVPFDMVPERGERDSLQRARDREALRVRRDAEAQQAAGTPATRSEGGGDDPAPLTRRQLRLQALAAARAASPAPAEAPGPATERPDQHRQDPESTDPTGTPENSLSVEAALEARRQTVGGQPDGHPLADDGDDLEVIARQRELAARAAIISRRVAERERIKRSNSERSQQAPDPFTGAMDRLRIEQAEKDLANTGINAPQTSGFRLEMPTQPKRPGTAASRRDQRAAPSRTPETVVDGASTTGEPGTETGGQPVSARSAQGLEPLDYLTAGVRRVNTWTLAVIAALAVGAAALVTGIVLISTNS